MWPARKRSGVFRVEWSADGEGGAEIHPSGDMPPEIQVMIVNSLLRRLAEDGDMQVSVDVTTRS